MENKLPCRLRGEGLVWLIGAVVFPLAAPLAMDGRSGIISSRQSAATSEIVKRFWSRVSRVGKYLFSAN